MNESDEKIGTSPSCPESWVINEKEVQRDEQGHDIKFLSSLQEKNLYVAKRAMMLVTMARLNRVKE